MANANIAATGIPSVSGPNGSVPLRREIRDLQANYKDQWNLYLLGLAAFQKVSETDLLSYYQLAGIHGEPYIPWNDVAGIQDPSSGGYCTHSSILFLPWHRPYLALYEQSLYAIVQGIAQKFPAGSRDRYVAAAKDFRMPYWDWAARPSSGSSFPSAISSPTSVIIDVDGATKQINNPLFSYQFPAIASEGDIGENWSVFPSTLRYPDRNDPSAKSRNTMVTRVIDRENPSLRNNVSLILSSYTKFDAFSNNAWLRDGQQGSYGSLEDIHNEIHDKVGGGGHMSSLEVSSFDPVFWLHHCNVDRLWAMWQALNPTSYVTPKESEGNFTIERGAIETANTELKPFWDKSGTRFWVSTGVKETTTFGYAYPETQSWASPNVQTYQAALRRTIQQQYGGNVFSNFFADRGAAAAHVSMAVAPGAVKETREHFEKKPTVPPGAGAPGAAPQTAISAQKMDEKAAKPVAESTKAVVPPTTSLSGQQNPPAATTGEPEEEWFHGISKRPPPQKKPNSVPTPPVTMKTLAGDIAPPVPVKPSTETKPNPTPTPATTTGAIYEEDFVPPLPIPGHPSTSTSKIHHLESTHTPPTSTPFTLPPSLAHIAPNNTYTEWITNLRAIKHGLAQTFRVLVFLGDFNPDPLTWPLEPALVGRFTVLGRSPNTGCAKCKADQADELVVTGTVPLTIALLKEVVEGRLGGLGREEVEPYLERNLHWRVTLFDGSETDRSQVPGLKVGVVSTQCRIAEDGTPVYGGEYVAHPSVTDGRPGGLWEDDDV